MSDSNDITKRKHIQLVIVKHGFKGTIFPKAISDNIAKETRISYFITRRYQHVIFLITLILVNGVVGGNDDHLVLLKCFQILIEC